MIRIYPIRTTKNKWNIFFYSKHQCSSKCEFFILNDENLELTITKNPEFHEGHCKMNNLIERTEIRLSSFDKDNPAGSSGPLLNYDEEVISDKYFTISLFYPFSYLFEICITSSDGFTLKELINCIKMLYKYIYEEEERTATPQSYSLKKSCSSCGIKNLSDYTENISESDSYEECCICYDHDKINTIKIKCGHKFHKNCLEDWVKTSASCPLCRYNIFLCEKCSGKGIIYYQYTGIVIPLEQRGNIMNRNLSNGIFGIHSYDYEDLILQSMRYDNKKKKLFINISG